MSQKHDKYQYHFYEEQQVAATSNSDGHSDTCSNNEQQQTNTTPIFFSLPKPHHLDSDSPLLTLRTEQSDGNTRKSTSLKKSDKLSPSTSPHHSLSLSSSSSDLILEPFAQECLHLFNGEFTVMHRKPHSSVSATITSSDDNNQQQYLFPSSSSSSSAVDQLLVPAAVKNIHPSTFTMDQNLLVKSHGIRLQHKFNEPLFCSLELIDIKHKQRVSERIWFHRNSFGLVNDFFEDLEMKRKVKDNGITSGNVIFNVSNQQSRSNDIYVVLWIWKPLTAQTSDQILKLAHDKKNIVLMGNNTSNNEDQGKDDHHHSKKESSSSSNNSSDGEHHIGLKQYLVPLGVSFAPMPHKGNSIELSGAATNQDGDAIFEHDGILTAMTHFLPPCSYHELFTNYIPNIQSGCSIKMSARTVATATIDNIINSHATEQSKTLAKKYKGMNGWFLFQVQSFNSQRYEADALYRAFCLYSDPLISSKLSNSQLRDAILEIQQFNTTKHALLVQQTKQMMQEEDEQRKKRDSASTSSATMRRRSLNLNALQSSNSITTGSMMLKENIRTSTQYTHLNRDTKSYLPLFVHEILPIVSTTTSPFFTFVHTLYIYPFSVDFTKLRLDEKSKIRPRNILLEISTREENGSNSVPRIYPPHYSQQNSRTNMLQYSYTCAVTYESKNPYFNDECKIELPLPIKSHNQRIVFHFYHLNIEKSSSKRRKTLDENGNVPKVLFATCELSMLDLVSRSDQTQNISLPLMKPNSTQFYDSKVNVFKLTTQIESTVYPREKSLSAFFKDCSPILNVIDRERTPNIDMKYISDALRKAIAAIKNLMKLPFNRTVTHYTLIIDMLISMCCRIPDVLKNFVETMDNNGPLNTVRQSVQANTTSNSNRSSGNRTSGARKSVAANRGSVHVDNGNRSSKGTGDMQMQIMLESANGTSSQPIDNKKSRFSLVPSAFKRRSKNVEESDNNATAVVNGPKPGDDGFDLRAYLEKNSNTTSSNTTANTASLSSGTTTSNNRNSGTSNRTSGIFSRMRSTSSANLQSQQSSLPFAAMQSSSSATPNALEEKKKRRFSVFNFGNNNSNSEKKKDEPTFTSVHQDLLLESQLDDLVERQSMRRESAASSLADDIGDFLSVSQHLFDLQNLSFQAITTLLKGACYVEDDNSRNNRLLSSYSQYIFKDVIMTTSPFCFILCELWTNVLANSDDSIIVNVTVDEQQQQQQQIEDPLDDSASRVLRRKSSMMVKQPVDRSSSNNNTTTSSATVASYRSRSSVFAMESPMYYESLNMCWFWFDMIMKSFMITVADDKKRTSFYTSHYGVCTYNKRSEKLYILLKDLIKTIADKIVIYKDDNPELVKSVNNEIGNLMKDLMNCGMVPPSYIFQLLDVYIYALDESSNKQSSGGSRFRTGRRSFATQAPPTTPAVVDPVLLQLKIDLFNCLSMAPNFLAWNNSMYHPADYMKETLVCPPVKLLAVCTEMVLQLKNNSLELNKSLVNTLVQLMSRFEHYTDAIANNNSASNTASVNTTTVNTTNSPPVMDEELRKQELNRISRVMFPYLYSLIKNINSIISLLEQSPDQKSCIREHAKFAAYVFHHLSLSDQNNLLLIDRKQIMTLLSVMISVFTNEDVQFMTMTLQLFFSVMINNENNKEDLEQILKTESQTPSETAYSRFLQNSIEDNPLASHLCYFIAQLLQRVSQTAELKKIVTPYLSQLTSFIQWLVQLNVIHSGTCYWRWIYANVLNNYTFSTSNNTATTTTTVETGDNSNNNSESTVDEFSQFIEYCIQMLHEASNDNGIGIDQLPPVTEEFILPTTVARESNATTIDTRGSICDEQSVSEFGVVSNSTSKSPILSPPLASSLDNVSESSDESSDILSTSTSTAAVEYENGVIKSGTLEQLLWRLVRVETVDSKFTEMFFLTYRSFCSPAQVVMYMVAQFRHIAQDSDRWHEFTVLRLLNSIKNWMMNHPYDFTPHFIANLFLFFKVDIAEFARAVETIFIMPNMGSNPNTASAYIATINRLKNNMVDLLYNMSDAKGDSSEQALSYSFSQLPPQPILPQNIATNDLLEWSPVEIARQMTLIEYGIFSQIKPKECFKLGWSKADKHERSPNIVRLIDHFNKMSGWIATLIIKEENNKKRGLLMKHWIQVAQECRQIGNVNGVNTIVSALNNSAVHRLKKTWETVSQKKVKVFKDLTELVSMTASYRNMRQAMQQINPPCVPYIGVYLTDLTFIEDGNKDVTKNNLINFAKRRQIARVILNIKTLQQTPYQFIVVSQLQEKLQSCDGIMEDSLLYKQSLIIEPR
jgi:hypothetical protein